MLNILDASRTSKPQQGAWENLSENIRGICFYKAKEINKGCAWGFFFSSWTIHTNNKFRLGFFYYYHPS